MVRFDGLPGEFAQFDFGEDVVTYVEGGREKITFFAGCLKFSRFKHVEVTPDQKAERLVRATVACLKAFGGAPKQPPEHYKHVRRIRWSPSVPMPAFWVRATMGSPPR